MPHDYTPSSQGMTECRIAQTLIDLGNDENWTGEDLSRIAQPGDGRFEGYPTSRDPLERPYIEIISAFNAAR